MAVLLRKVWGSVLARAASASAPDPPAGSPRGRRAPPVEYHGSLSLGALDAVPTDVLAQILRLLGPFDAARSSTVCRAWRILASDNGLWAFFLRLGPEPWGLVVFAETHLAADPASFPRFCNSGWNLVTSNHLCMQQGFVTSSRQSIPAPRC